MIVIDLFVQGIGFGEERKEMLMVVNSWFVVFGIFLFWVGYFFNFYL